MNGRIFIAPVGAVDDENRWLEIGMLTEDGIALAEQDEVDVLSWGQLEPIRTDRPGMPASSRDPVDPLDLIDRAVAGLCPCGTAPSEQFYPYCSYDCKPNHIGGDSDTSPAGQPLATPMRWRPDLVTAADEREMTPFTHRAMNAGLGHQVWLYPDGERVQLRVDDGYRFIGADLPLAVYQDAEQAPERARKWQALRRQLLNEDDLVHTGAAHAELLALAAALAAQRQHAEQVAESISLIFDGSRSGLIAAIRRASTASRALREAAERAEQVDWQRALQQRRERNTGPQRAPRAPRRIDPRRSR